MTLQNRTAVKLQRAMWSHIIGEKRTLPLPLRCFGAERRPESLNVRDCQNFIRQRLSGTRAE